MSYVRKFLVKLCYHFQHRLSYVEKIICLILATFLIVQFAQLADRLIVENKYAVGVTIGITLLVIGLYVYLKWQRGIRASHKRNYDINTDGGNYNRVIKGNYVQGDYINIQNNRVDMSKDITSILNEFRVILTQMQSQGYSTEQAVTQMAEELAKETRKKPQVKGKFHIDENADDNEVFEKFVKLLRLPPSNQTIGYEAIEDYGEEVYYKGHTIYLESDKDDWWHYKINGPMCNESGKTLSKYLAINEAKGKIDKARFSNW
jgi:hypothetical protein